MSDDDSASIAAMLWTQLRSIARTSYDRGFKPGATKLWWATTFLLGQSWRTLKRAARLCYRGGHRAVSDGGRAVHRTGTIVVTIGVGVIGLVIGLIGLGIMVSAFEKDDEFDADDVPEPDDPPQGDLDDETQRDYTGPTPADFPADDDDDDDDRTGVEFVDRTKQWFDDDDDDDGAAATVE